MIELRDIAEVQVLLPFAVDAGRATSPWYDTAEFRAELATWFDPLGLPWVWRPVTLDDCQDVVRAIAQRASERSLVVLNLCDGDELDGYPGATVVDHLEAAGLPFTGADASFYRLSTSKLAMKVRHREAGVATAAFGRLDSPQAIDAFARDLGFPAIVKLDVSADGLGLDQGSVAGDAGALRARWEFLVAEGYADRGIYAEAYVEGRECSSLVLADASVPGGLRVFPAVEMVYANAVPARERILFRGHRSLDAAGMPRASGAAPRCRYEVAPRDLHEESAPVAALAFRALGGVGYGRVDMRRCARTGRVHVLEVNANPSLSRTELSVAPAVAAEGWAFERLVEAILEDALSREPTHVGRKPTHVEGPQKPSHVGGPKTC